MTEFIHALAALVAIANPIGAVPVFLTMTEGMTAAERRVAAGRASFAVLVILVVAAVAGRFILDAFGISFAAFRTAGGLVILLMGLEMLSGRPTQVQKAVDEPDQGDDPIVVPFAMPLVAGPGAITTVVTLTAQSHQWRNQVNVLLAVLATSMLLLVALRGSSWIGRRMRRADQRILLRFMGLILAAIGAQALLSGIREFIQRG